MDLPDLQDAECAAVIIYRKPFCNAEDRVKAFRPKGGNLRQQINQKKNLSIFSINFSKASGANCHEIFGGSSISGALHLRPNAACKTVVPETGRFKDLWDKGIADVEVRHPRGVAALPKNQR